MAGDAHLGGLDVLRAQSGLHQLAGVCPGKIELVSPLTGCRGGFAPAGPRLAEGIPYHPVHLIAAGADGRPDCCQDSGRARAEHVGQGGNALACDLGGGALPSCMQCRHHSVDRIEEEDGSAVGHTDADHDPRLVGDDAVALQFQEVGIIGVGGIDDQQIGAVGLGHGDQLLDRGAEGARQEAPVADDVVDRVEGIAPEVERVVRGA